MKIYSLAIIVLTLLVSHNAVAQPWMNKLLREKLNTKGNPTELNFFEIQKAFNEYWKDRPIEKGKGWKQFKRWEWFMQSRVDKNGFFDKTALWKAWQEKKLLFPKGANLNNSNWTSLGPVELPAGNSLLKGLGRINCIAVDPQNNNIIWVGSPSGGLWKSSDGGNTWSTNTDFLDGLGVSSILISPLNSNIMYLGTGDHDGGDTYSIGILKSTDGGQSWFRLNNSPLDAVWKLFMHPSNENIVYACNGAVYKSTNGGANWITTNTVSFSRADLIMDNGNPNTLYATTAELGPGGGSIIIKSTNGGESWFRLTNFLPDSSGFRRIVLAQSASNPNIIYAIFTSSRNSGFGGVCKSTDSGNNWVLKANSPNMLGWSDNGSDIGGQGFYDLALIVHPTNPDIVYLGGINIWRTTNGGDNWQIKAHWYGGSTGNIPFVHADIHAFEFIPNTEYLLTGCDGGIFRTTNGGAVWQDFSSGLGIRQFYTMGGSAQIPNFVYGGSQDNGTSRLSNGIWTNVFGGDGTECAVDYSNPNVAYVSYQNGIFFRTTDGGNSFASINSGILENESAWVTPFLIHPTNPEILYRATSKVYKSTNRGNFWNAISGELGTYFGLKTVKVSKSNPNYIYVRESGRFYKTTNGGSRWDSVQAPQIQHDPTPDNIAIHPDNPEIIYIISSRPPGKDGIFKSTNAGNSWTDVTDQIPANLFINCIIVQDDFPNDVYIGTDIGVFYSATGGGNWQDYSVNLPNVIVSELEINNISGKIRAATYGRGLWESRLNQTTVFVEEEHKIPTAFQLIQNYPNPFNPSTIIGYDLPKEGMVSIKIYDMLGREVKTLINEEKSTGSYNINFDASGLPSGVYFYRLQAGSFTETKKLVLLR